MSFHFLLWTNKSKIIDPDSRQLILICNEGKQKNYCVSFERRGNRLAMNSSTGAPRCSQMHLFSLPLVAWLEEAVGASSHSFDPFSQWLWHTLKYFIITRAWDDKYIWGQTSWMEGGNNAIWETGSQVRDGLSRTPPVTGGWVQWDAVLNEVRISRHNGGGVEERLDFIFTANTPSFLCLLCHCSSVEPSEKNLLLSMKRCHKSP